MNRKTKTHIEKTYEAFKEYLGNREVIDSLEVVNQVEAYRQFWKPKNKTNVLLLAESHVFTDRQEREVTCKRFILDRIMLPANPNYPVNFVRFVYCLGYGEEELLIRKIARSNRGTPHFWKIFSNCVSEYETKVLKMGTSEKTPENLEKRLRNKVGVLRKMEARGIWLLDASIVGLTNTKRKTKERIIRTCWDSYLSEVIRELKPRYVVVIGNLVKSVLGSELQKLEIPFETLPQPRGQSVEYFDRFRRICEKYC